MVSISFFQYALTSTIMMAGAVLSAASSFRFPLLPREIFGLHSIVPFSFFLIYITQVAHLEGTDSFATCTTPCAPISAISAVSSPFASFLSSITTSSSLRTASVISSPCPFSARAFTRARLIFSFSTPPVFLLCTHRPFTLPSFFTTTSTPFRAGALLPCIDAMTRPRLSLNAILITSLRKP